MLKSPPERKAANRSDIFALGTFLLDKEQKQKASQVFQHMLELQQWGAFGFIDDEAEMRRL